jgi:hypothetical protein
MKNFMLQLQNSALAKLLTEVSDELPVTSEDDVFLAVRHIGKNVNRKRGSNMDPQQRCIRK